MASSDPVDPAALDAFVALAGRAWPQRLRALRPGCSTATHSGRAATQRHCIEFAIERCRTPGGRPASSAERRMCALAAELVRLARALPQAGRNALRQRLALALTDANTLVPLFHLLRTARLHAERGFEVTHTGLIDGTPHDLLIEREGFSAEIACEVVSAEYGRGVRRGAWYRLVDRIDPDLQRWLAAHPGRYLLKMTLPRGLQDEDAPGEQVLASLHARINAMLAAQRRADSDEAAVLRLDPLMLAAAQADEMGLMANLRREFGPEAQLAVTASSGSVFVLAARAANENEVAVSIRRRLCLIAPARLTGERPGILALFIEDTDRLEWRLLRERMDLEGEVRQFMTFPEARPVVAVSCTSRLELFGLPEPDAAPDGELRFRNPAHPSAKTLALAAAVLSSA